MSSSNPELVDPKYYRESGVRCAKCDAPVETFDVITGLGLDWPLGHVLKYVSRAGRKPGVAKSVDLEKAAWFLTRAIQRERNREGGKT